MQGKRAHRGAGKVGVAKVGYRAHGGGVWTEVSAISVQILTQGRRTKSKRPRETHKDRWRQRERERERETVTLSGR